MSTPVTPTAETWCTRLSAAPTRTPSRRDSRRATKEAAAAGLGVDDLVWEMPYLPIDPKDVGRSYEAVIRVNAQSGQGRNRLPLKEDRHLDLPRRLQIEFSRVVQQHADTSGTEMTSDDLWEIFAGRVPARDGSGQALGSIPAEGRADGVVGHGSGHPGGGSRRWRRGGDRPGEGNGPVDAFIHASGTAGCRVEVLDYAEHAMSEGGDAQAASYVECQIGDEILWGVGIDPSITTATLRAVISAVNRAGR